MDADKAISQAVIYMNEPDRRYDLHDLIAERDALQAELVRLREALEFYADKKNWIFKRIKTPSGGIVERLGDRGKIARRALTPVPVQPVKLKPLPVDPDLYKELPPEEDESSPVPTQLEKKKS